MWKVVCLDLVAMYGATFEEADMVRRGYVTDLIDAIWTAIAQHLPEQKPRRRPRRTESRTAVDAILTLLWTGCQWRLLPTDLPSWGTAWWCFRRWRLEGAWTRPYRAARALTSGLAPQRLRVRTVIADAGYERGALIEHLAEHCGLELRIINSPRLAFEMVEPS